MRRVDHEVKKQDQETQVKEVAGTVGASFAE
jgi:hypothetical protein